MLLRAGVSSGSTVPGRVCEMTLVASSAGVTAVASGSGGTSTGSARTRWPCPNRIRSARRSSAEAYRFSGFLARHLRTQASKSGGTSGLTLDGGAGVSRTCWYAMATGESRMPAAVWPYSSLEERTWGSNSRGTSKIPSNSWSQAPV